MRDRIRQKADFTFGQRLTRLLLVGLAGFVFGFLAKILDGIQGLEDIGTCFGLWILAASVLAVFSRSSLGAAVNVLVFFIAMVLAYYLYSMILFNSFYRSYFLKWSIAALLTPIGGFLVWHARDRGWIAAFCAALPIGALLLEGLGFIHVLPLHLTQFCFDMVAAVVLCILLPNGREQYLRVLLFVAGIIIIGRFIRLPF